jgi:hypothetical protein
MADICASGTLISLPAARISSKITFVSNKITNQWRGQAFAQELRVGVPNL